MKKTLSGVLLYSACLYGGEFIGSKEFRTVTQKMDRAMDTFADATDKIYTRYESVMADESLRWDGKDKKSKRAALTDVLKQYKSDLGAFNATIDGLIESNRKLRPGKRGYIAGEIDRGLATIKDSHDLLVSKLMESKKRFTEESKKDLNRAIWSIGGTSDELVELSAKQSESRRKFMDSFTKNIETFFSLYTKRMKSAADVFRGAKSQDQVVVIPESFEAL